jgi:hypothetical protein
MWFCAFHFDKTFCADGFPTTSCAVYIRWVELPVKRKVALRLIYEKADGTFNCTAVDNCFKGFSSKGN